MSAYTVLARKWRPSQFADIVGQTPVVRTLINAVKLERIHQAYLFTGSRGIGKTSIARIFAKALRCPNAKLTETELSSCDQCSSCHEISKSTSVDVIEIDGASNNGVDSVREIREGAKFLPSTGTRKIYIIDEVHMLSTAAFNALLKTLEEPPAHVIFIFATTEPHKIPATILSRCQRFDFKRVTTTQIQGRLSDILKSEGIQSDRASLQLLAVAAEGSMRDALSLLDQIISYTGQNITAEKVRESLGLIPTEALLTILKSIGNRNAASAIEVVQLAFDQGLDLRGLLKNLIEFTHDLIVLSAGAPLKHDYLEDDFAALKNIAPLRELSEWELIFQVLHHGLGWVSQSPHPKMVLDVLLIKCALGETLIEVDRPTSAPLQPSKVSTPTPQAPAKPQTSAAPVSTPAPGTTSERKTWASFLKFVEGKRPLLAKLLEHGYCKAFPEHVATGQEAVLKIEFNPAHSYKKEQLEVRQYQEQLRTLIPLFFEKPIALELSVSNEATETKESVAEQRERLRREKEIAGRNAVINHPVIREACALFSAQLGPIDLPEASQN